MSVIYNKRIKIMKLMKCFNVFFALLLVLSGCTKEFGLESKVVPEGAGALFPAEGVFKEGTVVTINAVPKGEYLFERWSGDASGTSKTTEVTINDFKSVTANFILKKYELILKVVGNGEITQTIVNTGKGTEYDSGTRVRLEAVPSYGYYFTGWSLDASGDTNPVEIDINRPKSVKATFEKLSFSLEVNTMRNGKVTQEIISTGKGVDYEFGTTVRLTAIPQTGSDFIKWQKDDNSSSKKNPVDILVDRPKEIISVFEFGLYNKAVGKWKIKKPKQSNKGIDFDVSDILFSSNDEHTFKLNYSSGQISGTFEVTSNETISLEGIGELTNVQIIEDKISFNMKINNLFQFDVEGDKSVTYKENEIYMPDPVFEQALIDTGYDEILDGYVRDSIVLSISELDLSNKMITQYDGLGEFLNLTILNLSGNIITDVSLVNLNKLTTLDLSNTGLTELDLSSNNLVTVLNLTGNPELECVKVSSQLFEQIPSGWTFDPAATFELECDCPTLSLISGPLSQDLCDGEEIQPIVFEFGGTDTTINVYDLRSPIGLVTDISNGTLTLSGTPIFVSDDYSFSVFTTDGKENCAQVSQTITLNKIELPTITLDSGSLDQTFYPFQSMVPIVVTIGGGATGLTFEGPEDRDITQVGNTYTIQAVFSEIGVNSGTITTISEDGCTEVSLTATITVIPVPPSTPPANTTSGGSTSGNTTSTNTFTCECPDATVGDEITISGTVYKVVDNSTIGGQIAAGNYNLCTTLVTSMYQLFKNNTTFNSDISFWDTSNVTNMHGVFWGAFAFNQDIGNWDMSSVQNTNNMFDRAYAFNQDISGWDTSSVINMALMFYDARAFNQPIGSWTVSSVIYMERMFRGARAFNQDINNWNTSNVTTMSGMFLGALVFNQNIGSWDTSSVTNMYTTFAGATAFNQNISSWDVSNVTTMKDMFQSADSFNGNLSNWNTSSVTDMMNMFKYARSFNQDISGWNVSSVTTMAVMFFEADNFNQDISSWNTTNVTNMYAMFNSADNFNQDLSGWCVSTIASEPGDFASNSDLTNANKPIWGTCPGG